MSSESAVEIGRLFLPIQAIANVLTAAQKDLFVRLPGLLVYYPCGIRGGSGELVEHGGFGVDLLPTGISPTGYDGNAYVHLGDGTNYLSRSGLGEVTGLETWIAPGLRGLTLGGWFQADEVPVTANRGMVAKDGPIPERGYGLAWQTDGSVAAFVSGTGSNLLAVADTVDYGVWHFIVCRFTPSTEIALFVNGVKSTNTSAIPASINVSTSNFELGRYQNDDARTFHGRARDVFVCAAALSDALIEEIRLSSVP